MNIQKPQVINHSVHGTCFLTTERSYPEADWLAIQNRKPKKNAVWYRAFPMSGGAIIVDVKNDVLSAREIEQDDIDQAVAVSKRDFNPALNSIKALAV